MDLTIIEAATLLGRSERVVRHLIKTGKLPAKKVGRTWRIESGDLALQPAAAKVLARKKARALATVHKALDSEPGGVEAPPPVGAAAEVPVPPRAGWSVLGSEVFVGALALHQKVVELGCDPGSGAEAGSGPCVITTALRDGLRAVCLGHHEFDRARKVQAY